MKVNSSGENCTTLSRYVPSPCSCTRHMHLLGAQIPGHARGWQSCVAADESFMTALLLDRHEHANPQPRNVEVMSAHLACPQELKGNIRVFARVRPASSTELAGENNEQSAGSIMATEFPSSGKAGYQHVVCSAGYKVLVCC